MWTPGNLQVRRIKVKMLFILRKTNTVLGYGILQRPVTQCKYQ